MAEHACPDLWQEKLETLGFKATPGASGGLEASLEGHPLAALVEEYGSPLVVVSERRSRQIVASFRDLTEHLGDSLRPPLRMGPGAFNDASSAHVFSPVSASPTQELLRRLQGWKVGFLAQSAGEVERALRAGARPSNIILCGAFKNRFDVILSAQLGLRGLEVESLAELDELCSDDVRAAARMRPLRVSLRVDMPWHELPSGLAPDEVVVALERIRRLEHLVCVGFSAGWRSCSECSAPEFEAALVQLRRFAAQQIASGHPIEYVLVGARSRLRAGEGEMGEEYVRLTRKHFTGAPFRVYFSCGDAIFRKSTHKVGRVIRVARSEGQAVCYVDIRYPEGWEGTEPLLPVSFGRGSQPSEAPTSFLGRSSYDHQPLMFGEWRWPRLESGLPVLLPNVGAAFAAAASACCSVPRPTELLLTEDGEIVVMRARDNLDFAISNEV